MKVALLDVSVLFALIYEQQSRHADVQAWFGVNSLHGWATCAYTQMSTLRLLTSGFAPDLNLSSATAASFLCGLTGHQHHQYWQQDIVPSGEGVFDWDRVSGRNQFPDLYLLALAVKHGGTLVTLDRKISIAAVKGAGPEHIIVL